MRETERVDAAQIVHRFILCALLKYTTFNEFSINFDWHFSLHTSLGRLSDRISSTEFETSSCLLSPLAHTRMV